jgi:1-acyl-sn-glycerol-3-phosphate acyltransferase
MVTKLDDGTTRWTNPTGRHYDNHPSTTQSTEPSTTYPRSSDSPRLIDQRVEPGHGVHVAELTHDEAHRIAREVGPKPWLVRLVRLILTPFFRIWFALKIVGAEHIPTSGAAVIAPNHKSFFDAFFVAVATKRSVRFMGKSELFTGRQGRLLLSLGGFPVKRGESDAEAMATAQAILESGGVLALFPEGTRVRNPEALGEPKRGAARLALETGAVLVPAAITGTEKLFLFGFFPKPHRVQVAFGDPIDVRGRSATPEAAAALLGDELWPQVNEEFNRLRARPGLIAAGVAAAGLGLVLQQRHKRR